MARRNSTATYIGIGVVAVVAIAACVLSWTTSRIAHDPVAIGHLWFEALAFIASGLGLVALVWTFSEQRKLTQNESCAYLEILQGRVSEHIELGFRYDLDVINNGHTPARLVELKARMTVSGVGHRPSADEDVSYKARTFELTAQISEISASGQWTLISRLPDDSIGLAEAFNPEGYGSGAKRYGSRIGTGNPEEDGPEPHLEVTGKLMYRDVFDRQQELPISQFMFFDFGNGVLRGTGRNASRFPSHDW